MTVVNASAAPPGPEHETVNDVVVSSGPVALVPVVSIGPDQPPDAEQSLALVLDHVSCVDCPSSIATGLAEIETVGGDGGFGAATGGGGAPPPAPPPPPHALSASKT